MMNNGGNDVTAPSTGRYVNPGHDRIAREFQDLRERENELRGRWKKMGFELPQVCSDNETPFTLPDPIPDYVIVSQRPNHIDLVSPQSREGLTGSRDALDAMSLSSSEASIEAMPSLPSSTVATAASTPDRFSSSVKVRPFEDPNEAEEGQRWPAWTAFSPLDETPIQREIRHAAEREHSLRQMRGLKTGDSGSTAQGGRRQDAVKGGGKPNSNGDAALVVVTNRRKSTPCVGSAIIGESGRLSMRNFASARLQLEIEREKQREMDLLRLGCIRTTSTDHIASITSNDETGSVLVDDTKTRRAASRSSYVEAMSNLIELQQQQSGGGEPVTYRSSGNQLNGIGRNGDGTTVNGTAKKRWSTVGLNGGIDSRNHSMTSELIERELRELEQRERELRMQRSYSCISPVANSVDYDDAL